MDRLVALKNIHLFLNRLIYLCDKTQDIREKLLNFTYTLFFKCRSVMNRNKIKLYSRNGGIYAS